MPFEHKEEHTDTNMILIQANIDDMNPEYCTYVAETLFVNGANDVYWIPIIMKKGRPGIMLNVLVNENLLKQIETIIFTETTTLGIRYLQASCHRLGRELIPVQTKWGTITVKAGFHDGKMVQYAPEFSQCEEAAKKHHIPLKDVYAEVNQRFLLKYQNV